ncbi:tyrosine-type recombinase/integrase [Cellulomonas sp. McL0617]|uniref:tyrosine-type recombinase/integrase n=1 Tax=Cellulomonas sp. McL0617 TaxID=3415675 RepID=UPI003CFA58B0
MAALIDARTRSDGGISYRVRWRLGGTRAGSWQSETFSTRERAASFKLDVDDAGQMWPDGWVKGRGWVVRLSEPVVPAVPTATFNDVVESYFERQDHRIKRGKVKPFTVHTYRRQIALHLEEEFAGSFLAIEAENVEQWIDNQIDAGAAPKSIRNRHGMLFSLMRHGQKVMRLRADNPCETSELPDDVTREARQVRFFQPGEWALLRSCIKVDALPIVDMLLATGMRAGEVFALRAGDLTWIDEDTVSAYVVRAWSTRSPDDESPVKWDEHESDKWVLGPPKSRRPRRVQAAGAIAHTLRGLVEGQSASAYVFRRGRGKPWRYTDFRAERWLPATARAAQHGLTKRSTPHMLRHTTVVWGLADGVPIQVISEMLGHASIQITYDIYGGLIDLKDPRLARAMAKSMLVVNQAITPVRRPRAS